MAFVKVNPDTLAVLDERYDRTKLQADHPLVLLPSNFFEDQAMMARYDVHVIVDDPPDFDPAIQRLTRTAVTFDGSEARQGYSVDVYVARSYLQGGERHPTSAELGADVDAAQLYWEWCINGYLAQGALANEFRDVQRVRGALVRVGRVDNATAYTREPGPFRARAILVENWRIAVWSTAKTLEGQWLATLETATPAPAPTWDELRAQLPPWPVPA